MSTPVDRDPEGAFERLHAAGAGALEVLVLVDTRGAPGGARARRLFEGLVSPARSARASVGRRRRWLVSIGLLARSGARHRLTPLGRQVLGEHAAEVIEIRKRIEDLLEEEREADADRAFVMEALLDAARPPAIAPSARREGSLELPAGLVRAHASDLELPEGVIERAAAALSAGKHLILAGPPGTGKTALALALGEAAREAGFCGEVVTATASADWTTFDTIGGYALGEGGALRFREGLFVRAIDRGAWLVVDELNRADADRAFGELLTVLAGHAAVTPFLDERGRPVSIGPGSGASRRVPPTFRVVATLNTWDRASLFRLSFALERRFARVHVGVPDDVAYARLIRRSALGEGEGPPLDPASIRALEAIFSSEGILAQRAIGPAIALDVVRYVRRRRAPREALAEAAAMYVVPQLEGLAAEPLAAAREILDGALSAASSARGRAELAERLRDLAGEHA